MAFKIKNRLIELGCFAAIFAIPAAVYAGDVHGQYLAPIIANLF